MRKWTTIGFLLAWTVYASAADKTPPNFVIINIDDLGYADITPFGSEINRTPHLDRMAKEGKKLTHFYAAPVCSPSRAMLMTGSYPKRALPIPHVLFPGNAVGLHPDEVTLAEALKEAGYATGIIGKWHLGDQPEFLPTRQGFDEFYGLPYSNDMGPAEDGVKSNLGQPLPQPKPGRKGQPPLPLMRNETVLKKVLAEDQTELVESYSTEAEAFIRRHKDHPFFLYLPHSAVHFPIYPGKKFQGRNPHGYYSDWVEEVDASVGRVLQLLRDLGLEKTTLVIFTSDNGGTPRASNAPLRGHKASTWEGGVRVPTIAWWPGTITGGGESDAITGMFDLFPTFLHLAGKEMPQDGRARDGMNIWPVLRGNAKAHESFLYYRGLQLEAVRHGDWKLHLKSGALYHLKEDPGETTDRASEQADVVSHLKALAEETEKDLGKTGKGPGVRPLGEVPHARPLILHDGSFWKASE